MEPWINLEEDVTSKAVDVLLQLREKTQKKALLADTDKILVTFCLQKIPKLNSPLYIPVKLPHSLVTKTSDVCLIVKDIDRRNREYEDTAEYYENLLKKHGITQISQVTPLKSIKLENQPYELKRRFALMYDFFLADSRIVRFLPHLLGKDFLKNRTFVQVHVTKQNLKDEINKGLCKSRCIVRGTGCSCCLTVGNVKMSEKEITDNIMAAVRIVTHKLPGGPRNIRTIHVKTPDTMPIPIYYSDASSNTVMIRMNKPVKKSTVMKPQRITTLTNAMVQFTDTMTYKVIKKKMDSDQETSDEEVETEKPKKKKRRRGMKYKEGAKKARVEEEAVGDGEKGSLTNGTGDSGCEVDELYVKPVLDGVRKNVGKGQKRGPEDKVRNGSMEIGPNVEESAAKLSTMPVGDADVGKKGGKKAIKASGEKLLKNSVIEERNKEVGDNVKDGGSTKFEKTVEKPNVGKTVRDLNPSYSPGLKVNGSGEKGKVESVVTPRGKRKSNVVKRDGEVSKVGERSDGQTYKEQKSPLNEKKTGATEGDGKVRVKAVKRTSAGEAKCTDVLSGGDVKKSEVGRDGSPNVTKSPKRVSDVGSASKDVPVNVKQSPLNVTKSPKRVSDVGSVSKDVPVNVKQSPLNVTKSPKRVSDVGSASKKGPVNVKQSPLNVTKSPKRVSDVGSASKDVPVNVKQSPLNVTKSPKRVSDVGSASKKGPVNVKQSPLNVTKSPKRVSDVGSASKEGPVNVKQSPKVNTMNKNVKDSTEDVKTPKGKTSTPGKSVNKGRVGETSETGEKRVSMGKIATPELVRDKSANKVKRKSVLAAGGTESLDVPGGSAKKRIVTPEYTVTRPRRSMRHKGEESAQKSTPRKLSTTNV